MGTTPLPETQRFTYVEFAQELRDFVNGLGKSIKLKTKSGVWDLEIFDGAWRWNTDDPRIEVIANPFPQWRTCTGNYGLKLMVVLIEDDEYLSEELNTYFGIEDLTSVQLWSGTISRQKPNRVQYESVERNLKLFLMHIYTPKVRQVLDSDELVDFIGVDYKTWETESYVSSYQFNYPPREGTMTQKFTDYLKENPRRTSNQFYEDVLGYPRPRAHNNMFFCFN